MVTCEVLLRVSVDRRATTIGVDSCFHCRASVNASDYKPSQATNGVAEKEATPQEKEATPQKEEDTPQKEQEATPQEKEATPQEKEATPQEKEATTKEKEDTPQEEEATSETEAKATVAKAKVPAGLVSASDATPKDHEERSVDPPNPSEFQLTDRQKV